MKTLSISTLATTAALSVNAPIEGTRQGGGFVTFRVRGVTHIALHESVNGKGVEWLEHVGDEQYWAQP